MKYLRILIIIAAIANLILIPLFIYGVKVFYGYNHPFDLLMEFMWAGAFFAGIFVSILYRKELFKNLLMSSATILLLFLCTPFTFAWLHNTIQENSSKPLLDQSYYSRSAGKVIKTEHWVYSGPSDAGNKFADKKFISDSVSFARDSDKALKKDSIWVYFKENGDTLKIEKYNNDILAPSHISENH